MIWGKESTRNMIVEARVEAVYPNHTADVEILDSAELIFGVRKSGRIFWNLQKDDLVLVAYLGDEGSNPIIFDSVLPQKHPLVQAGTLDGIHFKHEITRAPEGGGDPEVVGSIELVTDENGAAILNMSGSLAINVTGEEASINLSAQKGVTVIAEGDISVNTSGKATVAAQGDVDVTSEGKATLKATGDAQVESTAKVTVKAPTVDVDSAIVNLGKNPAKQLCNNLPACIISGAPHAIGNVGVKA